MDVAIASCLHLPEPDPDEELLLDALTALGLEAEVLAWDDPAAPWSEARITVLRSTWNYPHHHAAFLAWAKAVSTVSDLWNGLQVVRWNSHKKYLLELERNGVETTPTELLEAGTSATLARVIASRDWGDVVVKPAVSAASYGTLKVGRSNRTQGERHLAKLLDQGDVLVQSFLPSVEDYGERALIWIDGEFSHAVRKSPRFAGDDESVSEQVAMRPDELRLAGEAIHYVSGRLREELLYARVDLAPGPDNSPVLMEFELIEPSLFLKQSGSGLSRFAEAINRKVTG